MVIISTISCGCALTALLSGAVTLEYFAKHPVSLEVVLQEPIGSERGINLFTSIRTLAGAFRKTSEGGDDRDADGSDGAGNPFSSV